MKETRISVPELVLVAGTRAALGAGLGLLIADRLSAEERRAAGWTLFLLGALTTIPLAFEVFGGHRLSTSNEWQKHPANGSESEGSRVQVNERLKRFAHT